MYLTRSKKIIINIICLLGIIFASINALSDGTYHKLPAFLQTKVHLGLELQGGSYLQMQVDLPSAHAEELQIIQRDLKKKFKKNKIKVSDMGVKGETILFTSDAQNIDSSVRSVDPDLSVKKDGNKIHVFFDDNVQKTKDKRIMGRCMEVVRYRIDETGTKEPHVYTQGDDRIIIQLPGIDDPEDVKKLIGQTARLTFKMVKHEFKEGQLLSDTEEALPVKDAPNHKLVVDKEILLTGDVIENARITPHEGKHGVDFAMNRAGAQKFSDITLNNKDKQFAIILDNTIISAPLITVHIPNGQAIISGSMTIHDAQQLRLVLNSGALPAPLKVIEERVVGPTLGADSIHSGKIAVLVSFAFVTIFMLACYSLFGLFASISVIFNIVFLLAALSILHATLTLPGIAGIALTIGMAVDANVLIYERIKEELRLGIKPIRAITLGFERAMSTIIDSNLTTLIGAAVLYQFGSGPVRGFAVTLALGIIVSMFTALTLTYYQIYMWTRRSPKLETLRI